MNNDNDEIGDLRPDGTRIDVNDPRESPAEERRREFAELIAWCETCPDEDLTDDDCLAMIRFFLERTKR
jgi:hypothetical protein